MISASNLVLARQMPQRSGDVLKEDVNSHAYLMRINNLSLFYAHLFCKLTGKSRVLVLLKV